MSEHDDCRPLAHIYGFPTVLEGGIHEPPGRWAGSNPPTPDSFGNNAFDNLIIIDVLSFPMINEVCSYKIQSSQAWNLTHVFQILSCSFKTPFDQLLGFKDLFYIFIYL